VAFGELAVRDVEQRRDRVLVDAERPPDQSGTGPRVLQAQRDRIRQRQGGHVVVRGHRIERTRDGRGRRQ
jgi:hypothetical protein